MSEVPDRLYIERKDRERFYNKILAEDSPLGRPNFENKDIFLLAMSLGFQEKNQQKLETKEGYFMAKNLTEEDEALLYALAVYEEDELKVLLDKKRIYSIAEEYAKGGIPILYDKVFSGGFGSFKKKFEAELVRIFNKTFNDG